MSRACGGNNRRFSTCTSRVKFLRLGGGGKLFDELIDERGGDVRSIIEGIPKDKPASLEGFYGLIDGPFQSIYSCISRDPGWLRRMPVSTRVEGKCNVVVTYLFDHQTLAPVRCRS